MKLLKKYGAIFALLLVVGMLSGCGGSTRSADDGAVQDIQPGDQSIIQPPSRSPAQAETLEERSL